MPILLILKEKQAFSKEAKYGGLKISYSKRELIENLISFKDEYSHYPTRQDFKAKRIVPSKTTYHRVFGGIENAIKQAELVERGDLIIEDEREIKSIKSTSKKGSFQCPLCGNWINDADKSYSSLVRILSMRFINLLRPKDEQSYHNGVMDCIHAVFGGRNLMVRQTLKEVGYLEKFEKRYKEEEQESGSQGYGEIRCYKCGKLKKDWETTVDTTTKFCKPICEDCLAKKGKRT